MQIEYNGSKFSKHPKQKYFYATIKGKKKSLHRKTWEDYNGEIPTGYDIHHKDGDQFNNDISNLEIICRKEHARMHGKERAANNPEWAKQLAAMGRPGAAKWHGSEDGIKWHLQHAANFTFGKFDYGTDTCEQCNGQYTRKTKATRFCSNKCKSAWRRHNCPDMAEAQCAKCGTKYQTLKYLPKKYCSKECQPIPNPYGSRGKADAVHRPSAGV